MSELRYAAAVVIVITAVIANSSPPAVAQAPLRLTTAQPKKKPAPKPAQSSSEKSVAKPAHKPPAQQAAPASVGATPPGNGREADMAYGAYQRGFYMTAFAIATRRVEQKGDVKAMTLLGELYANGYGIARDDAKAAEWYRLAADRGDRDAMFALAMFHLGGRI